MERKTYMENPSKMQKLKSQSNSRSPAGTRLPSYPVHDYPLQTPPTREFRQPNRIVSPDKPDSPELLLLDNVYNKIQLESALQIWRQKTLQRRQKKRIFQQSLATSNFDIEPRINSIYRGHQTQSMRKMMCQMKHQLSLNRESTVAEVILNRRTLCKYFGQWQSRLTSIVQKHTAKKIKKAEAYQVSSIPDMMARLHSLLTRQAELETELESKEQEIADISAVIKDNQGHSDRIDEEMKEAMMENQRVVGLKNSIDHDYKDQIATLKMSLSKEINLTQEKIEEGQQRLAQQEKAKKITSNNLFESQEALQNKMNIIKEKLATAQSIALQMRDQLLRNDEEQTENSRELIMIQGEIARMREECNNMSNQSHLAETANNQSLDKLKDVYAQTIEQFNQIKVRIRQNNQELTNQDARLESLTRELALCRQRSKTAMDAFREDDENTF